MSLSASIEELEKILLEKKKLQEQQEEVVDDGIDKEKKKNGKTKKKEVQKDEWRKEYYDELIALRTDPELEKRFHKNKGHAMQLNSLWRQHVLLPLNTKYNSTVSYETLKEKWNYLESTYQAKKSKAMLSGGSGENNRWEYYQAMHAYHACNVTSEPQNATITVGVSDSVAISEPKAKRQKTEDSGRTRASMGRQMIDAFERRAEEKNNNFEKLIQVISNSSSSSENYETLNRRMDVLETSINNKFDALFNLLQSKTN
eukprot:GCRY01001888.1.p1 GENE.GCRY01001888.1~~GCRY01001888.1.p1  ORF type:complete len:258 (-),score=48.45 GCRY01001888.1:1594-2367(-)